ncbi:MAG: phage shock protein C, PspC [uncultured bacterium]|nr:MAG: phage shock protein C, PspC [uncultured bacterium]
MSDKKLYRSKSDRIIAGICGGLSDYLDVDAVFFRLAFVLLMLAGGSGVLIYIIMFVIIPEEGEAPKPLDSKEYKENREKEIKNIATKHSGQGKLVAGVVLILLGIAFLTESYLPESFNFEKLWPLVLIIVGVTVLAKKK